MSILVFAMNANEVEKGNDFFMGKTSSYFYGTKHMKKSTRCFKKIVHIPKIS